MRLDRAGACHAPERPRESADASISIGDTSAWSVPAPPVISTEDIDVRKLWRGLAAPFDVATPNERRTGWTASDWAHRGARPAPAATDDEGTLELAALEGVDAASGPPIAPWITLLAHADLSAELAAYPALADAILGAYRLSASMKPALDAHYRRVVGEDRKAWEAWNARYRARLARPRA